MFCDSPDYTDNQSAPDLVLLSYTGPPEGGDMEASFKGPT